MSAAQTQLAEIVGTGVTTCSQFLRDYERNPLAIREYFAWSQDYTHPDEDDGWDRR